MDLKTVCNKGIKYPDRKRVGRGIGSGLGKTAGRGHKGWGARSGTSRRPGYEGGQMPIYRRVPKRGFSNARFRVEYTVVNVETLQAFADGDVIDMQAVLARGLVSKTAPLLKVLGQGELTRKLTVRAHKFSGSAKQKIEAAGGTVETLEAAAHRRRAEASSTESGAENHGAKEARG
jgi:large subunit ribosomal protein L15